MKTLTPAAPHVSVWRPLPGRWIDLLRTGVDAEYGADHAGCMAVAVAMVRCGWTLADFMDAMLDPSNALSAHYRLKDPERGRRRQRSRGSQGAKIRRDWAKAVAFAADRPQTRSREEALQHLGLFRAAVAAVAWLGTRRADLQRVLVELIMIGMAQGSVTPTVSTRSLAQRLGCHEATASRRLRALQAQGWLIIVVSSDPTAPSSYRLTIPPQATVGGEGDGVQNCNTSLPLSRGDRGVAVLDSSELETELQLDRELQEVCGTSAALVAAALEAGARAVGEVRRLTGLARQTIYTHLRRLRAAALVVRDAAGRWMRTARTIVEEMGAEAAARRAQRVERHAWQRATWQDRFSRYSQAALGRAGVRFAMSWQAKSEEMRA